MPAVLIAFVRFALDVALKATILLSAAGLLLLLLRRASAAVRHTVSTLALAGVVVLPLLTWLPGWEVALFPDLLPAAPRTDTAGRAPIRTPREPLPSADRPGASHLRSFRAALHAPDDRPSSPLRSPLRAFAGLEVALALWAIGAIGALAHLLSSTLRVRAMAREAAPLCDPDWVLSAEDLRRRLGLSRPVALRASDCVSVAMTCGVRRPVLLVPPAADQWTSERRRVVLLHELAHVARRDWLALMIAEVALSIYWFHPLVWIAVGQARRDCEKACDDMVLGFGTKASVYAAHLLDIVRSLQDSRRQAVAVVSMARATQFEGRMLAILDAGRVRRTISSRERGLAIAGTLIVVLTVAALEPWACPNRGIVLLAGAGPKTSRSPRLVAAAACGPETRGRAKAAQTASCPKPAAASPACPSEPARRGLPAAPLRAQTPSGIGPGVPRAITESASFRARSVAEKRSSHPKSRCSRATAAATGPRTAPA